MIKGMIVNKEELLKQVKQARKELNNGNMIWVDCMLADLQRRLSEDLKGSQEEFQMYDKVRIISVDRDPEATYPSQYLYKVGRITHIDRDSNYPYRIEIEGEVKSSTAWLWKAEDLRLVGRA